MELQGFGQEEAISSYNIVEARGLILCGGWPLLSLIDQQLDGRCGA